MHPRTTSEQITRISAALKLNCSPNDVLNHCQETDNENRLPSDRRESGAEKRTQCVLDSKFEIRRLELSKFDQNYVNKTGKKSARELKPQKLNSDCRGALNELEFGNIVGFQLYQVRKLFDFHEEIGKGAYGTVRKCSRLSTQQLYACKTIHKSQLKTKKARDQILSEASFLRAMQSHPCVVKLVGEFEDSKSLHLVMEHCEGGDLFNRVKEMKFFSEQKTSKIVKKIASVLAFAHEKGIMHRDIKPENILLVSRDSDTDIRLADFGSATKFTPGQKQKDIIGSPLYIAPSVLKKKYGTEADLWSLGVVMYILLAGKPPFKGRNNAELYEDIQSGPIEMDNVRMSTVSQEAKDLILRLLNRNPKGAISASQVLLHPWILKYDLGHKKVLKQSESLPHTFELRPKSTLTKSTAKAVLDLLQSSDKTSSQIPSRKFATFNAKKTVSRERVLW